VRKVLRTLLVVLLVLGVVQIAIPQTAEAAAGQSFLTRGQELATGQSISTYTQAGAYTWLIMQSDGNLVLYTTGTPGSGPRRVCWASGTSDQGLNSYAVYQNDQNFVIYYGFGAYTALWASGTRNDGGTTVNINRYGQLWAGYKKLSGFCT
jgi:hypothetical protein